MLRSQADPHLAAGLQRSRQLEPLLSSLGGGLGIAEQPAELHRRAARLTVEQIGSGDHPEVAEAVDALLDWRDNNWQELEESETL